MLTTACMTSPCSRRAAPRRGRRRIIGAATTSLVAAGGLSGLLFSCAGPASSPAPTPLSFQQLASSDHISVRIVARSDELGDTAFDLAVVGGSPPQLFGSRVSGYWSDAKRRFVVEDKGSARIIDLSEKDLRDLDRMLEYYRVHARRGVRQTRDSVHTIVGLTQASPGRTPRNETYVDGSGHDHDIPGVTTFWDLIPRLDLPPLPEPKVPRTASR